MVKCPKDFLKLIKMNFFLFESDLTSGSIGDPDPQPLLPSVRKIFIFFLLKKRLKFRS